jgi:hypothetical protein
VTRNSNDDFSLNDRSFIETLDSASESSKYGLSNNVITPTSTLKARTSIPESLTDPSGSSSTPATQVTSPHTPFTPDYDTTIDRYREPITRWWTEGRRGSEIAALLFSEHFYEALKDTVQRRAIAWGLPPRPNGTVVEPRKETPNFVAMVGSFDIGGLDQEGTGEIEAS